MRIGAPLREALSRPAPATLPAGAPRMSFRPDPRVSARVRDEMAAYLDANGAGAFAQGVRSGKLLQGFDGLLRRYGYSPQDFADVVAAHVLVSWEIVNARDSTTQPRGQRAVRRQLAGPFAASTALSGLGDAALQAQAERTSYMTMIAAAGNRTSDASERDALRARLRSEFQALGIDLRDYVLTDDGLVPRGGR